jgi:hypothetical protein
MVTVSLAGLPTPTLPPETVAVLVAVEGTLTVPDTFTVTVMKW